MVTGCLNVAVRVAQVYFMDTCRAVPAFALFIVKIFTFISSPQKVLHFIIFDIC